MKKQSEIFLLLDNISQGRSHLAHHLEKGFQNPKYMRTQVTFVLYQQIIREMTAKYKRSVIYVKNAEWQKFCRYQTDPHGTDQKFFKVTFFTPVEIRLQLLSHQVFKGLCRECLIKYFFGPSVYPSADNLDILFRAIPYLSLLPIQSYFRF